MNTQEIVVIINGHTYTLSPNNSGEIGSIPAEDRQQLIALLESLKQQSVPTHTAVPHQSSMVCNSSDATDTTHRDSSITDFQMRGPERLGSGDVDGLVAQLIMEERNKSRQELTKYTLYKWIAIIAIITILLLLLLVL